MPPGDCAEVHNRVIQLVDAILVQNGLPGVTRDTRLVDAGLTSMEMVNLMLAIEAAFDLTLPQSEITPENFESIDSVARMILRRQPARAA